MSSQQKIDTLLEWCRSRSIVVDPRLALQLDDNGGIGVFSNDVEIPSNTSLVKIPKNSVLSTKSCALAEFIIPAPVGLEAQLALSLALLSEMRLGPASAWYGYLQSLPDDVELPFLWDFYGSRNPSGEHDYNSEQRDRTEALEWLRGTEADKILSRKTDDNKSFLEEAERYFNTFVKPLLERQIIISEDSVTLGRISGDALRLDSFLKAYALVSSRAFMVDAYHGLAMVPIADAFNHIQENHVHLETDYHVCHECGSLKECHHDRHGSSSTAPAQADDECYEMVSNAPIPPNSEVYNTYGETLTNAQLLTQYGFTLDVNDNDRLTWSVEEILDIFGIRFAKTRHNISQRLRQALNSNRFVQAASISTSVASVESASGLPPDDLRYETSIFVNADGQISIGLWVMMILIAAHQLQRPTTLVDPTEDILLTLTPIFEFHTILDSLIGNEDDPEPKFPPMFVAEFVKSIDGQYIACIRRCCKLVAHLCSVRKRSTGRAGIQGGDIMDTLEIEGERTGKALLIAMSEQSTISSCKATWKELPKVLAAYSQTALP